MSRLSAEALRSLLGGFAGVVFKRRAGPACGRRRPARRWQGWRRPPAGAAVAALEVERRAGVPAADDGRGRGALAAEPGTSTSAAGAAPWSECARQP